MVWKLKSYHFETSGSIMILWFYAKNSPEKNPLKCMGTKDVYNHWKKGANSIKNTPGYVKYADA